MLSLYKALIINLLAVLCENSCKKRVLKLAQLRNFPYFCIAIERETILITSLKISGS